MAGRNFDRVTREVRANDYVRGRRVVAQNMSRGGKNKVRFEDGGTGSSGG